MITNNISTITLNEQQQKLFDAVTNKDNQGNIFLLRGYAGTGKTVTASKIVVDSEFKKILILAPTQAAKSVLSVKIPSFIPDKQIDFSTISRAIELPAEQIVVMGDTYQIDYETPENVKSLHDLQQKLTMFGIWEDMLVSEQIIYGETPDQNKTRYILNEALLKAKLVDKFQGMPVEELISDVTPTFNKIHVDDIARQIGKYELIIIDEMSMVSEEDVQHIIATLNVIKDQGKTVPSLLLAGDKGQLPPVNAELNHFFAEDDISKLEDVHTAVELETILRSTDTIAQVAKMIRTGMPIPTIVDMDNNATKVNASVKDFVRDNKDLLNKVDVAIAYKNKDVFELGRAIRQEKGFSGSRAQIGERLIAMENTVTDFNGNIRVANGEELTVKKIYTPNEAEEFALGEYKRLVSGNKEIVEVIDFVKLAINAELITLVDVETRSHDLHTIFIPTDLFKQQDDISYKNMRTRVNNLSKLLLGDLSLIKVNFGYARTIHKSQGSEWDKVLTYLTKKDLWIMNKQEDANSKNLIYTGYTRAATDNFLVYNDKFD